MQALKVATVPMHVKSMDQYVLVDKEAYNKLLDQSLLGRAWIMDNVRDRCGNKSIKWIKENIIENPKYSRQIGRMEQQGQIIHKGRGSAWKFKASVMADFFGISLGGIAMVEVAILTWALTSVWYKRHEIRNWFGI